MLNIKYIYEDAINALENYSDYLEVPSVAITVYMLQQDVINSYKYALEHYSTISLSEPYLKNSSLGTPYQKWKHFTNENYISLSFSINNLLRYTSRLLHESELLFYENERRYEERTAKSNKYTGPICEISFHDKFIGIRVLEGEQLELSRSIYGLKEFESEYSYSMTSTYGGESHYYKTLEDSTNLSAKIEISKEEFHEACAVVKSKIIDIHDRDILLELKNNGLEELKVLDKLLRKYEHACRNMKKDILQPFSKLNESWWIG